MSSPEVACPHCGSADVESVGAWGGQLITSQARCRRCNTYFEVIRDVFAARDRPVSERPNAGGGCGGGTG